MEQGYQSPARHLLLRLTPDILQDLLCDVLRTRCGILRLDHRDDSGKNTETKDVQCIDDHDHLRDDVGEPVRGRETVGTVRLAGVELSGGGVAGPHCEPYNTTSVQCAVWSE